ncbi:ATP-binding protein [Niveispirillum irakense]|uniref:ATP-binding protein n=1 Tax=Niveispirillum irakense TaxID=34011 RepID=UPI0004200BDA|nr:ATP-binding protein [Niveispirillum irakense]
MILSLRTRIILLFVPLLLVLSGLGAGLVLLGHRTEAIWGLNEQARAAAVALAELVPSSSNPPEATLADIAARNEIVGLRLFDAAGGQTLSIGTSITPSPPSAPTTVGISLPDDLTVDTVATAIAPLADGGWLVLELSTARQGAEEQRLHMVAAGLLAAGALLGLVAALLVAGRIAGRLRALKRRMGLMSSDRLDSDPDLTGITEIEDLDDALRTMHSVLRARRARSERLCIENEQFRTVHDLVGTLVEATQPDIDTFCGGRRLIVQRVGGDAGQILRLVRQPGRSHLLLGSVQLADPLDRAIRAGAIGDLLAARLAEGSPPAQVLAEMASSMTGERLLVVSWDHDSAATSLVELRAGKIQENIPADEAILSVGLLTGGGERLLHQYMERFVDVALEARAADLSTILQRRCVGVYALITNPASTTALNRRPVGMDELARLDMVLDSRVEEIPRLADAVEAFCDHNAIPPRPTFQFNLCFDELLTNVIQHGLDGAAGREIKVSLVLSDIMLQAEIVDDGPPFDPLARPPVDIDADLEEREIGGLGVHMVRTMMDMVSYRRQDDHNHFRFGQRVAGWKNDATGNE